MTIDEALDCKAHTVGGVRFMGETLRDVIAKAGRVVMQAAEMEAEAVAAGELDWAARFADTQARWSAVAFAAAKRVSAMTVVGLPTLYATAFESTAQEAYQHG